MLGSACSFLGSARRCSVAKLCSLCSTRSDGVSRSAGGQTRRQARNERLITIDSSRTRRNSAEPNSLPDRKTADVSPRGFKAGATRCGSHVPFQPSQNLQLAQRRCVRVLDWTRSSNFCGLRRYSCVYAWSGLHLYVATWLILHPHGRRGVKPSDTLSEQPQAKPCGIYPPHACSQSLRRSGHRCRAGQHAG